MPSTNDEAGREILDEETDSMRKITPVDVVCMEGSLDHPREIKAPWGTLIYGCDLGAFGEHSKQRQEDAIVVNTSRHVIAVVDGMGGYAHGDEAASLLAHELQRGFRRNACFEAMQQNAHHLMRSRGLSEDGACYLAVRVKEKDKRLDGAFAGNVQCAIANTKGRLRFVTEPEGFEHCVDNAVQGVRAGTTARFECDLYEYDRLLIGSDGLWHNLSVREALQILGDLPSTQAFHTLWQSVKQRMQSGEGVVDNVSIVLYDFSAPKVLPPLPPAVRLRQAQTLDELMAIVDEIGGLPGVTGAELRRNVLGLADGRIPFSKLNRLPTTLGFRLLVEGLLDRTRL